MMTYRHPFHSLTPGVQKRLFALLCLFTIIVLGALTILGIPLKTERAPLGIVSFEFAGDLSRAQHMIASWGQNGRVYAALNLGLDYLFLVLYASCLALSCAIVADNITHRRSVVSRIGIALSWAQFGAGGLDAVENAALIQLLFGFIQPVWPVLAWWCAFLKFTIVLAGLGYILGGTINMFIQRAFSLKRQKRDHS